MLRRVALTAEKSSLLVWSHALGSRKSLVEASRWNNSNSNSNVVVHHYHSSGRKENVMIYGGLAMLAAGVGTQYAMKFTFSDNVKGSDVGTGTTSNASKGDADKSSTGAQTREEDRSSSDSSSSSTYKSTSSSRSYESKVDARKSSANTGSTSSSTTGSEVGKESGKGFWDTLFARSFYDGGFEEKMTKREAALILGVRESASAERIKDAHRRIMQINHPDKGGSAYMTAKINEAKLILLKGK